MIAVKDSEFDARLLAGIRVALQKARELGYPVERMDVTASLLAGYCSVHFGPIADQGTIVTGGDLSLIVDPETEEITQLKRGQ
jgi:hypothetical protein